MEHVQDWFHSRRSFRETANLQRKGPQVCSWRRGCDRNVAQALFACVARRQPLWLVVCFVALLFPSSAWSQAGFYVHPGFSIGEFYDDNVFRSVSGRQDDMVTRLGAGVQGGYESPPFTLLAHYRFVSEIYAKHPRLTNMFSLQDTGIDFSYLPTRLWTLGVTGGYVDTERPETINVASGVLGDRTRSRNYNVSPSLFHLWSPFTTLGAIYTFNNTEQTGGITTESHTARLIVDRRLNEWNLLHLGYIFRRFQFTSENAPEPEDVSRNGTEIAHVPTIGWTHQLSPLTSFTVNIGPRFSRGSVTPEVLATLRRELQYGLVTLTYARTQNTVVGEGRPVTTDSVILSWDQQLLRNLLFTVTPGFYNNTGGRFERRVYGLDLEALYQINKWLGFRSSYQVTYEEGQSSRNGDSRGGGRYRNIILFELVAFSSFRLY